MKQTEDKKKLYEINCRYLLHIIEQQLIKAADSILIYFYFSERKRTDISCESYSKQTIHIKCHSLFSLKKPYCLWNISINIGLPSATLLHDSLRIKYEVCICVWSVYDDTKKVNLTEQSPPYWYLTSLEKTLLFFCCFFLGFFCLAFYFKWKYFVLIDHILSETIWPVCFCVLFLNMYLKMKWQLAFPAHRHLIFLQSTLVISNSKGLYETLRDIRTSTYQICGTEQNN